MSGDYRGSQMGIYGGRAPICPLCTNSRSRTVVRIEPRTGYAGYDFVPCELCRTPTYEEGAAVAFGLMGMAEAIRMNAAMRWVAMEWPDVCHRGDGICEPERVAADDRSKADG